MLHALRVTQPTRGDHSRRGQLQAASRPSRQPRSAQRACPAPFVPAGRARPNGIGPPHGTVHWDAPAPIPSDDHQHEAINARQDARVLAAPPGANQAQLLPILAAHRVIDYPRPLPAALRGRALARHLAPERLPHLHPQAPPLEPGALRKCPEQARGPLRVSAAHATQLGGRATATKRRQHHPDHLAKELVLAA